MLIGLVALAPLPLGSNRPLGAALLASLSGIVLLGWSGLKAWRREPFAVPPRQLGIPLILFSTVCLWILLQAYVNTPWNDPIWNLALTNLGRSDNGRISVDPTASLTGLMHLLTYFAIFWLSVQLGRNSARAQLCLRAVVIIGAIYSLYGIVVYFAGNDTILVFKKWAYRSSLTSTFVNRNSFATFAGLSLLSSLALMIASLQPLLQQHRPFGELIASFVEHLLVRIPWTTAAMLIIAIALLLTSSRGGAFSTACGALVLVFVQIGHAGRGQKKIRSVIILSVITLMVVVFATGAGKRLSHRLVPDRIDNDMGGRLAAYSMTIDGIETTPWTGIGFGAYEDAIPAYKRAEMSSDILWDKAHNTYLENAFELGIPASGLLCLSIALLGLEAWRGARTRRRYAHIPATGIAATILVTLHSLVDFSLQIPAISALYALLIGIAVAQSRSTAQR